MRYHAANDSLHRSSKQTATARRRVRGLRTVRFKDFQAILGNPCDETNTNQHFISKETSTFLPSSSSSSNPTLDTTLPLHLPTSMISDETDDGNPSAESAKPPSEENDQHNSPPPAPAPPLPAEYEQIVETHPRDAAALLAELVSRNVAAQASSMISRNPTHLLNDSTMLLSALQQQAGRWNSLQQQQQPSPHQVPGTIQVGSARLPQQIIVARQQHPEVAEKKPTIPSAYLGGNSNNNINNNSGNQEAEPLARTRMVPCGARGSGIAANHNSTTAYFTIPSDMPHGKALICSHSECRKEGVKFQYCAICGVPVARRFFRKRHEHPGAIIPGTTSSPAAASKTTAGRTTSAVPPPAAAAVARLGAEETGRHRIESEGFAAQNVSATVVSSKAGGTTDWEDNRLPDALAFNSSLLYQYGGGAGRAGMPNTVAARIEETIAPPPRDKKAAKSSMGNRKKKTRERIAFEEAFHEAKLPPPTSGKEISHTDLPEKIHFQRDQRVFLSDRRKKSSSRNKRRRSSNNDSGKRKSKSGYRKSSSTRKYSDRNEARRMKEWEYLLKERPPTDDDDAVILAWLQRVISVSDRAKASNPAPIPASRHLSREDNSSSSLTSDSSSSGGDSTSSSNPSESNTGSQTEEEFSSSSSSDQNRKESAQNKKQEDGGHTSSHHHVVEQYQGLVADDSRQVAAKPSKTSKMPDETDSQKQKQDRQMRKRRRKKHLLDDSHRDAANRVDLKSSRKKRRKH